MSRAGQKIDRYHLLRLVGGGSFGDVYLANDTLHKKQVALKILRGRDKSVDEFINEAQVALLRHRHIVPLLGFGRDQDTGMLFLVMEYMPEGTLRQRHPRGSRLSLTTVVAYVKQIADALDYAHKAGLVHRDVKPENILIGPDNIILLSDFGIATSSATVNPQLQHGAVGTWLYMAPEQIEKEPIRQSDQYALAVITYEWLVGTPPFQGDTCQQLAHKHTNTPPPSLREQVESIPQEVEEVIMQALAKEPKQRFASVGDFARALERASRPAPGTVHTTFTTHTGTITSVAWSPDGLLIASADSDGTGCVWEAADSKLVCTYNGHTSRVECIAWSPGGEYIASADAEGMIHIWQATSGVKKLSYKVCLGRVFAVAWSPDGKRLASADSHKKVQVWQAMTGRHIIAYQNHASEVECVAWSPDGEYLASGGYDTMILVREVMTGNISCVYAGHKGGVYALAWSSDGTCLASASFDSTIQIWGIASKQNMLVYRGHTGGVFAVSWSPQHSYIASGGDDGTVQVWDAQMGARVILFQGDSYGIRALAWSPDGLRIASGGLGKVISIWQVVR